MGKVVKFTGSRLLGEELRRLRGGRTLDDVVEMGRSKLLQYGFKGVAKATLSEIENGRTLPNIESVFALSILYQVPTSRFLHLLLEENLIEEVTAPESGEELHAAFTRAVHEQRPTEALALASRALKIAAPGWETLRWRLNRATAIERLGMRWDAIAELQEAIDHPDLPALERYRVHRELARMHTSAGQFSLAEMHLERTLQLAPEAVPPPTRANILAARARLVISKAEWGHPVSPEAIEQAEVWVSEALSLLDGSSPSARLGLVLSRATLAKGRGDARAARSLFTAALADARALHLPDREVEALHGLADLSLSRNVSAALKHLTAAASLALDNSRLDYAFLTYFRLHELAESKEQRAHYFRKCQRLYPLVQSTHPCVRAFERLRAKELR